MSKRKLLGYTLFLGPIVFTLGMWLMCLYDVGGWRAVGTFVCMCAAVISMAMGVYMVTWEDR